MLSIRDQKVHKNNGLTNPIIDLNFIQETASLEIEYAISNSYAFGGHNGSLLFKRYSNKNK